jgi:hypothetical protein
MSSKINGGYKGYDGRFLTGNTAVGHIQREQHFLERTQGRLPGIALGISGPYIKTLVDEDFESGDTSGGPNHTWTLNNGAETNYWVVGDDRPDATSGGTYHLYITNGTTINGGTPSDNVYTDAGGSDTHAIMEVTTPDDWYWDGVNTPVYTISFNWRCLGEGTGTADTQYDYGYVRFTSTGLASNAGTLYTTGRFGGGTSNLFDNNFKNPQNYTNWYTEISGDGNTPFLIIPTGDTASRIVFSWHDDAAGGTAGNPPFAIDNITITYTACTIDC